MSVLYRSHWLAPIKQHEKAVLQLARSGNFRDATITDSPINIGKAYAASLDILHGQIGHRSDFEYKCNLLINNINSWIISADDHHNKLVNSTTNLNKLHQNEMIRIMKLVMTNFSMEESSLYNIMTEIFKLVEKDIFSGNIENIANYYAYVQHFKSDIENSIAINLIGRG
jgi:hypothetical protein